MAEEKKEARKDKEPAPEKAPDAAPKKKSPIMLIAIVGGLMVAEGAGMFLLMGATGKKPAPVAAAELHGEKEADEEHTIELPFIEDEFQTMQGTQVWIWDTQMVLQVKKRNEEHVTGVLERRDAEIKEEIAKMFRRATANQLREPGLETLNRQVLEYLTRLIGKDAEGHGRIERVLIPRCRGFFAN